MGIHLGGGQSCQREEKRLGETWRCLWLHGAAQRQWQFPGLADEPETASQGTQFCTNTWASLGHHRGQGGWPSPQCFLQQAGACGPRHYPDLSPFSVGEVFVLQWATAVVVWLLQGVPVPWLLRREGWGSAGAIPGEGAQGLAAAWG